MHFPIKVKTPPSQKIILFKLKLIKLKIYKFYTVF